jgi:hypothetical protein
MTNSEPPVTNPTPAEHRDLPLEELELTPEWVKSSGKSYADHTGADREAKYESRRPNRDRDRDRHPRPPKPAESRDRRGPRPDRRGGGPPQRHDRDRGPSKPAAPPVLPVEVTFQPEDKGFAAMIEAMKQTQRAYALFDIAKLVLNKPERHWVKFTAKPAADGTPAPLFLVTPGENIFLRQDEAVRFVLRHHAEMVYREKKTPIDPPKGNFTFVNRCGLTGVWLGPPNYHEYQSRLVRHHQQRLRHIPFDEFKSRIQTVKDPEAIKAWVESMSVKSEYECILDTEPKTYATRDELERHFVETHLAQFITSAPEVRISGTASRQLQNAALVETVRLAWMQERKFPLKTANEMRGKLRHEGFHFFKDPKGITYIGRVKPQRFESIAHLTDQIQKIILYLREHFGCTRKQLIAHFVPRPAATAPAPTPAPDSAAASPAPVSTEAQAPACTPDTEPAAPSAPTPPVPSEEDRVLTDLHWLIQDGYVVEFSNGRLWALADKPPQPPTPAAAPPTTESPPETTPETATETGAEAVATTPTAVADEPASSPAPAQAATESAEPTPTAPATS